MYELWRKDFQERKEMSIRAKEIGWSQEANLYWQILKKLERINSILGIPSTGTITTTSTTTIDISDLYLVTKETNKLLRLKELSEQLIVIP